MAKEILSPTLRQSISSNWHQGFNRIDQLSKEGTIIIIVSRWKELHHIWTPMNTLPTCFLQTPFGDSLQSIESTGVDVLHISLLTESLDYCSNFSSFLPHYSIWWSNCISHHFWEATQSVEYLPKATAFFLFRDGNQQKNHDFVCWRFSIRCLKFDQKFNTFTQWKEISEIFWIVVWNSLSYHWIHYWGKSWEWQCHHLCEQASPHCETLGRSSAKKLISKMNKYLQ